MARRPPPSSSGRHTWRLVLILAAWWPWMPLGAVILWLITNGIFGGYGQQAQGYVLFLQADLFPHGSLVDPTTLFWIWVCVGLAGTLVIVVVATPHNPERRPVWVTAVVLVAAMVVSLVYAWNGLWNNDKREAQYYTRATVFYAAGLNPAPSSLRALTDSARKAPAGQRMR